MQGCLYIVGTPIGNLGDISPRALEILTNCDFIAAEDTRVTLKLLNHFGIKTPMVSYHEHNKAEKGAVVMERIINGENCALVTDAGMPAISDPGEDLVRLCHKASIKVESVPGPCAFVTALAISGMYAGRFCFEGFLSVNKPNRKEHLESLREEKRTMIFYEAPHKLANTLKDLYEYFGDRETAIVHELTKIHESIVRTTLAEASQMYNDMKLKGEYVIIVDGLKEAPKEKMSLTEAIEIARQRTKSGMSKTEAAKSVAREYGIKKSEIYDAIKDD